VGIIRHTSVADATRILWANSAAALVLLALHTLTTLSSSATISPFNLTLSLILTHYLLLTVVLVWLVKSSLKANI
jgi:hypothetical protein